MKSNVFQPTVVKTIKTDILSPLTFVFSENRAVYEITWKKNGGAREAAGDNMAARSMQDNLGYTRKSTRLRS